MWCSFGTTWNKQVALGETLRILRKERDYEVVNVSEVVRDILKTKEPRNPGVMIQNTEKEDYCVVTTGDSYSRPQILEIKLKNNY